MTQASTGEITAENAPKEIGKISPATKVLEATDAEEVLQKNTTSSEKSIIEATRLLLKEFGVRKSGAAIRDAIGMQHSEVGPKEAVSALTNLGFKASFGSIKIKNLIDDFFPLIAFDKGGKAFLVKSNPIDEKITLLEPVTKKNRSIKLSDFKKDYSSFFILVKQLNDREKEERSGHWFFSSFRKSKWIYVEVMIAAMVSNFLSLTTALFTMTVYDRVIPNGAFESLIALSSGVVIALAFDFLIKSLRAKFIDTASKRADLEISRRLFERILTLAPNKQRQNILCQLGY